MTFRANMPLKELIRSPVRNLIRVYAERSYPLLPATRMLREPLRWLYHQSPTLRHDSRFDWRANALLRLHRLLVREHPEEFTIHHGQIRFRSFGSIMSVQGYYVGEIERHLMDFVIAQLHPDFTMLDVGAHHGAFTLVVAHELRGRGWPGRIHSFEPDPGNFALLEHNIRQNGLTDYVVPHRLAVSNFVGQEDLVGDEKENSGNTLASTGSFAVDLSAATTVARAVPVTMLDSFLDTLPTVDLVKMDIQGAEPLALIGAKRLLARDRPVLTVEAVEGWPSSQQTRAFLQDHDYHIYGITSQGHLCPAGSEEAFVSWDLAALPGGSRVLRDDPARHSTGS